MSTINDSFNETNMTFSIVFVFNDNHHLLNNFKELVKLQLVAYTSFLYAKCLGYILELNKRNKLDLLNVYQRIKNDIFSNTYFSLIFSKFSSIAVVFRICKLIVKFSLIISFIL